MATEKEIEALKALIELAAEVNASSPRVDVTLDITRARLHMRISDPVEVLANCDSGQWSWLYYNTDQAYFSDEVFKEEDFLLKCQNYCEIIEGFRGHTVQEEAQ